MADFFIRRPIVAMVIAILTVIVGVVSLSRLPISEYPPVSPTMIQVTTTYRGAAAESVMESVATPIESKVNGVDKLLYPSVFQRQRWQADAQRVFRCRYRCRYHAGQHTKPR
jgi:multidrug efflux pump subunit AcrB